MSRIAKLPERNTIRLTMHWRNWSRPDPKSARTVHRWIGSNMGDATSPNDPVFFLHHCYIDMLWEKWRKQHPTSAPYLPASGTPGYDLASKLVFNKSGKPAPWTGSWRVKDTLHTTSLGYTYA